jgi:biopolymer transport protein ExbD
MNAASAQPISRRRGRRSSYLLEPAGSFPVIPMIDVMLNLLIFFMLISRYLPPALELTLPQAANAQPTSSDAVRISIQQGGTLAVDGTPAQWAVLPDLLSGHSAETPVHIAADKSVDYDYIVKALDAAAQAGLQRIALETTQTPAP